MERSFTVAVWMFLLFGFLQAKPVCEHSVDVSKIHKSDLRFKLLKAVPCAENVTFVDQTSMPAACPFEALRVIKEGLEHAIEHCGKRSVIRQFLGTLRRIPNFSELQTSPNATSEGTRVQFAKFVENTQRSFERFKSA